MRVIRVIAVFILFTAAPVVRAEKVTGKIVSSEELKASLAAAEKRRADTKRAYYWNEPNGIVPVRPPSIDPSRDLAVVLFRDGASDPKPDPLSTVKVHAGALERRVVVTRPGSTIRFRNVDPFDHALFSPTLPVFKAEQQSNGAFRPIEFQNEGVYEVHCRLMPHFKAYVVVTKASAIVPVKPDGTFALADVEAGNYTLKVFHEGKWLHTQSFALGNGNPREAKLEIELKPESSADAQSKDEKKGQ
ncbi:MAG: hypothetical protein QNJ97_12325 [Myxococcota bacterium]|nr:hypothetical protein [Myxococcota bacterium]